MSTAIEVHGGGNGHALAAKELSQEQIDVIKNTVAKGCTDAELSLFVQVCNRTGLDPFAKQVYAIRRKQWSQAANGYVEQMTIQTAIDGFRVIAERSRKYQGQTEPQWCGPDGAWKDIWLDKAPPAAGRIGVYRAGFREPIYAVARFDSYAQRNREGKLTGQWTTMPDVMIAKCAEALALRKAFPHDLSGLYTKEELDQASNPPLRDVTTDDEPTTIDTTTDADPVATARAQSLAMLVDKKFGRLEREARLDQAFRVLGRKVDSFKDLSRREADELFARWGELPDHIPGTPNTNVTTPHPDYVPPAPPVDVVEEEDEGLPFTDVPYTLSDEVKDLAIGLEAWVNGKGVRISPKAAELLGIDEGIASLADMVAIGKLEQLRDMLKAAVAAKRNRKGVAA